MAYFPIDDKFNVPRRFIHRHVPGKTDEDDDADKINFQDIVDWNEYLTEQYLKHKLVRRLLGSAAFKTVTMIIILIDAVAVGLETDEELNEKYSKVFTGIKQCVLTYYALEICLKWFYNFFVFWIDLWNVLDFALLIMAISIPRGEYLGGLRLIRVVRYAQEMYALTDLKLLRGMVIVSRGILLSLLPLVDILLMVLLLLVMLSTVAVIVLGEFVPKYYGYFSLALFNLFSTFTNEVWSRIHYVVQNKTGTMMFYILVVFNLAVIFLGTFFVRGLCLATLHSNLELATEQVEAEEKLRAELRLKAQSDKNKKNSRPYEKFSSMFATNEAESSPIQRPKVQTMWAEKLFRDKNYSQRQCEITDLSNLSAERVTNYFMLLTALSENFNEYIRIRTDLERLVKVICDLQSSLAESQETAKGEKVKVESELSDDARAKLLATREELEKRKLLFSKLGDRETVLSQMSTMKDERSDDVRFTFAPYL